MELKQFGIHADRFLHNVLLVPLWNWNLLDIGLISYVKGFTRTFMELKHKERRSLALTGKRFTRTFMELKPLLISCTLWRHAVLLVPLWNWNITIIAIIHAIDSFTRTFMELKQFYCQSACIVCCVLLVPLWNWNSCTLRIIFLFVMFYSYLYGIETHSRDSRHHYLVCFTRTFMELKLS